MIDFLNACGRGWLEPFALVVVQNTLFLGLVFAALWWLRNASAWVRYLVALAGVSKLLAPPFVPFVPSPAAEYIEIPAVAAGSLRSLSATTAAAGGDSASLTLSGFLFAAWCAVAVGVLAYALVTTVGLRLTLRGAGEADDEDSRAWRERTGIGVRVSERVPVPMTVGLFPRTIFVPPQWMSWSSPARRAVLRHEVAHIRRRDGVTRALETVAQAVWWFHPLVPVLVRRIGAYREQACDEAAAAPEPSGRIAYSRTLVEIAEDLMHRPRVRSSASTLMRRRHELLDRVDYLTQKEGTIMKMSKTRMTLLVAGLAVAITSLSWYRGTATPQDTPPPPPPPKMEHKAVDVSVGAGGEIAIAGEKTSLEKLEHYMQEKYGDKDMVVRIVCDKNAPVSAVFKVQAVLRGADMLKVSYTGLKGEDLPMTLPSEKMIEKAKELPAEDIAHLKVGAGGKCALDGEALELSMVTKAVAKRLAANEKLVVSLEVAEDAAFGDYVEALKALKAADAKRIFVAEPGM